MKNLKWFYLTNVIGMIVIFLGATISVAQSSGPTQATPPAITIEALSPDANVRSAPAIAPDNVIGQIQPTETYAALGRYFEWVLIEYLPSPNQRAWVFSGVVRFHGGTIENLPNIDPSSIPPILPTATSLPPTLEANTVEAVIPTQEIIPVASPLPASLPTFTPVAITPTPVVFSEIEGPVLVIPEEEVERRVNAVKLVYSQPITLLNGEQVILLDPVTVGFAIDEEALRAEINPSLRFSILNTIITADYSPELLDAYIEDLALRYRVPAEVIFDANTLTFQVQTVGQKLDTETLRQQITTALFSPFPIGRTITMNFLPDPKPDVSVLREAILTYFNRYGIFYDSLDSVVSVYVEDLATGESTGIQSHVLHSATSTAKIGVIANYFRYVYQLPSQEIIYRMLAAIICSSNADANILMNITGNGDDLAGLRMTTDTFCRAGAGNTRVDHHFFIGPAGEGAVPVNYYDPAGAPMCSVSSPLEPAPSFPIDEGIQTTAADMGHFLSEIYACATQGEGLATYFPSEITQEECGYMLEILRGTNFSHMIELGVPPTVEVAHKVGYAAQAAADAGIVFSPNGDYVITIYMWDERLGNFDNYALSRWTVMGEVSRIVYNFFNPDAPLLMPQTPLNPNGGAACVLPSSPEEASLININAGRFDENGEPLPTACYDWPNCRPFDNWGRSE